MSDTSGFSNLVPGFEFLQNLVKNAGASLPGVGQWVAPTLDPQEIEKRISELRTVQFWLEQNAKMLSATIQALEVQRMTLSTLKTMNVQMADLRESLQIKLPDPPEPAHAEAPRKDSNPPTSPAAEASTPKPSEAGAPAVDPMQWWGALTKQFTELASNAMQPAAGGGLAGAMGRSTIDGVKEPEPAAVAPAGKAARKSPAKGKRSASGSKKAKSS
ncbi:MAG: PhaM family polyhydroxyalkanoate granule multifunctional regulatory protein [Ideonella sp.]